MNKKYYVAPAMDVVELKLQGSLLSASSTGTIEEKASLNNFEEDWD